MTALPEDVRKRAEGLAMLIEGMEGDKRAEVFVRMYGGHSAPQLLAADLRALLAAARGSEPDPESIARRFHETYERLAPEFGYETRPESAVPWEQVPENNRRLMVAVVSELTGALAAAERANNPPATPPVPLDRA